MGDDGNVLGAALRAALGAERCGRCDEAVLDYVASVLQDDQDACADVDAALEAVGPLLVRRAAPCRFATRPKKRHSLRS